MFKCSAESQSVTPQLSTKNSIVIRAFYQGTKCFNRLSICDQCSVCALYLGLKCLSLAVCLRTNLLAVHFTWDRSVSPGFLPRTGLESAYHQSFAHLLSDRISAVSVRSPKEQSVSFPWSLPQIKHYTWVLHKVKLFLSGFSYLEEIYQWAHLEHQSVSPPFFYQGWEYYMCSLA